MADMTIDPDGGLLSVTISVGAVQKCFWSVSRRAPKAGGGFGSWIRVATFDDVTGGDVNQIIHIDDCAALIGSQIAIVFFVMRVNFAQADPYQIRAGFSCAGGQSIAGGEQVDHGVLDQPHVLKQCDFTVEARR